MSNAENVSSFSLGTSPNGGGSSEERSNGNSTEWLFGNSTLSSQNDFQIKSIQQKLKNIQEKKIHAPTTTAAAPSYYGNVSRMPTVYDSVSSAETSPPSVSSSSPSSLEKESFVGKEGMDCGMEPVRPVDPNSIGGKFISYLYYPYDYTKIGCRYVVENITAGDDYAPPNPAVDGSQIDYIDLIITWITGKDKAYFKKKLLDSQNNPDNTLPPKPSNGVIKNIVDTDNDNPDNNVEPEPESFVGREGYVNTDITNDYTIAKDKNELEKEYSKKPAPTTPPKKINDEERKAIDDDTNALTEYCVRVFLIFFSIPLTYYFYDILVHYDSLAFTSLIEFERGISSSSGEESGPAFYYRHNFHPIVYVDTVLKYVSNIINKMNIYPKLTFIIILYFAFNSTRYFVNTFMHTLASMVTGNVSDIVYYMIMYSLFRHKIFDAEAFMALAMGPWMKSVVFMIIFFFGSFVLWVACLTAFASITQLVLNVLFMLMVFPLFKDTIYMILNKLSFGYVEALRPSNYSEIHDDMPCDQFSKILDSYVFPYIFQILFFMAFLFEGLKSFLYYRFTRMRNIMFWSNMSVFFVIMISMFFVYRSRIVNKI
jgi:hypothetical protein